MRSLPRPDARHPLDLARRPIPIPGSPYIEDPREDEVVVARRLALSFDGRASGTQQILPLAIGIDSSAWVRATLVFMLHSRGPWLTAGGMRTTAQVTFTVDSVMLDPDDPSIVIADPSRTLASSPSITSSTSAPLYQATAFTPPIGPQVRMQARFTQGATAAGGPQALSVSIVLVGKRK